MALFGPPNIDSMKKKKDIQGLIKALEYKENFGIRKMAAFTLGELNDPRAIDPLIAGLKDNSNLFIRRSFLSAIKAIGWIPKDDSQLAIYSIAHEEWEKASKLNATSTVFIEIKDNILYDQILNKARIKLKPLEEYKKYIPMELQANKETAEYLMNISWRTIETGVYRPKEDMFKMGMEAYASYSGIKSGLIYCDIEVIYKLTNISYKKESISGTPPPDNTMVPKWRKGIITGDPPDDEKIKDCIDDLIPLFIYI